MGFAGVGRLDRPLGEPRLLAEARGVGALALHAVVDHVELQGLSRNALQTQNDRGAALHGVVTILGKGDEVLAKLVAGLLAEERQAQADLVDQRTLRGRFEQVVQELVVGPARVGLLATGIQQAGALEARCRGVVRVDQVLENFDGLFEVARAAVDVAGDPPSSLAALAEDNFGSLAFGVEQLGGLFGGAGLLFDDRVQGVEQQLGLPVLDLHRGE